jgi:hypothetical protein
MRHASESGSRFALYKIFGMKIYIESVLRVTVLGINLQECRSSESLLPFA